MQAKSDGNELITPVGLITFPVELTT